jgi:hypothetical protein
LGGDIVNIRSDDGMALVIVMMAMLLMTALGAALVLTTSSETIIAGHYRNSGEVIYAADAALELALDDLLTVPDWNALLDGSAQSAFVDGPPSGNRTLPDGSSLDLTQVLNLANCQKTTACTASDMEAITADRPWGPDNPRWQLYAYGRVSDLIPSATGSSSYVVVLAGDDPSENDGNPLQDGTSQANPGSGVLALRAEAFGPRGAHKVIELTVARTDANELERGYTGQRGQNELNQGARKTAVQTPGEALTLQTLDLNTGRIR